MELNALPTAASMLVVCVVALGASMPADAYGQRAQASASDPTGAAETVEANLDAPENICTPQITKLQIARS